MSAVATVGDQGPNQVRVLDAYGTLNERVQRRPPRLGEVFSDVIGPIVGAELDGSRPLMLMGQDQQQDEFECDLLVNAFAVRLHNGIEHSELHQYKWSALKLRLTQAAVLIKALDVSAGAPEVP